MDWVQEHCDNLRSKLQSVLDGNDSSGQDIRARTGLRVPWSWVCRSIIETLRRYPSGLTEAVILAELELLWRRDVRGAFVPGKLQAYLDAQYAPLSDVIQACVVRHSDQLVTLVEDHSRSVSYGQTPAKVDMYLHQNFKSCLHYAQNVGHDLLAPGRKLRLTGCRMLTGATVHPGRSGARGAGGRQSPQAAGSTLLLTEYLAFVLDHRRSNDLSLAAGAFGPTRVRDTFDEGANHEPFFVICKVVEIRRPRQHQDRAADPTRRRRLAVQTIVLECAGQRGHEDPGGHEHHGGDGSSSCEPLGEGEASGRTDGERETVLLHLWDEQMCLASLFQKGDGLAIFWPWVVQSGVHDAVGGRSEQPSAFSSQVVGGNIFSQLPVPRSPGWHYEYGSATALFVLPRESRARLFSAANGSGSTDTATEARVGGPPPRGSSDGVATGPGKRAEDSPADENGLRDLLHFQRRLSVADLAPNMSNASVYGQVVSVCVPGAPLPAVLPCRSGGGSLNQASLSQPQSRPLLLQPPNLTGAVRVVELEIGDGRGVARVLCCGRKAAADALRCRPGHFVLACGLRTFAPAFPPLDSQPGGEVVVFCGEPEEAREGTGAMEAEAGAQRGNSGGGETGGDGVSRILNASCLEGLLHCPSMSRHSLLHDRRRAPGPHTTLACKVAVTWARWAFDGDGLWAVHRRCGARLPLHHGALSASADSMRKSTRKRGREMRDPGARRTAGLQDALATCPLCKSPARASCPDDAELAYAPLLLALDDGSRCIVAECRRDVVTAALGGIHAHFFLKMGHAEREATLMSLVGREIRCVVGTNGADGERGAEGNGSNGCFDGGDRNSSNNSGGGVKYRVESIASANSTADLAQLLL